MTVDMQHAGERVQGVAAEAAGSASVLAYLRAVVAASERLVAETGLQRGVDAALEALRLDTGLDRVYVFRDAPGSDGMFIYSESSHPRVPGIQALFGDRHFPDDQYPEVSQPLRAGRIYQSVHTQRHGANAAYNEALSSRSDLMVPIVVEGRFWGAIGFDDCRSDHVWNPSEIAALQGAASAIAAAVLRDAADRAQARTAADLAMRDRLLAAVALALQALLGSDDGHFADAVHATLAALGAACGIHRIKVILQRPAPEDGEPTHFLDHEWWSAGMASQTSLGLTRFPNTLVAEWVAILQRGEASWYLIDDVPMAVRAAFARVGVRSVGSVPVFGGGQYLGLIAFDDCVHRRVWSDAEIDALTAAARTIGSAIHKHSLQQAMLAERDRRVEVEQARAEESARHALRSGRHADLLAAVASAAADLLAEREPGACLDAVLARIGQVTQAERACVARLDWTPDDPCLLGWQEIAHEWARPGSRRQMDSDLRRFAMQRSDGTWERGLTQFATESRILVKIGDQDEPFRSQQTALGIVWSLCYPILVGGQVWGLLGFDYATSFGEYDEADLAALQTVASNIAAALLRQQLERRALDAVRARAEELARLAERVDRHAQLLAAVAASAEDLLAAREPWTCMDAILARLSDKSGAHRAALNRFDWTPDDPELLGWQEVVHEWVLPGETRQMDTPMRRFAMRRDEPIYDRFEKEFRATGRIVVNIAEQEDGYRSEQQGLGVVWSLGVPFFVDGVIWGALGFDYATPYVRHDEAEISALQTVASSIADALIRQRLEARTLAVERQRGDDNARHAGLLAKVVQSSRSLIDAEPQAFEPALLRWLGTFGEETRASRATFYDLVTYEATGQRTARMLCEWVREGVTGNIAVSFSRPFVIDPRGAEEVFARMTGGEAVAFHTDSMTGPMREFMQQQGNASVITVPIFIDGRQWGNLSFDYAEHHELEPAMVAVLQTAADTLAAVLKRNDVERMALEERDLRIALEQRSLGAERARAEALRTANDGLIASMARLVALQDLPAFMSQLLLALTRTCGAHTGSLLSFDSVDGRLWMRHCVIDGELVGVQADPRLTLWRQPVPDVAVDEWRQNLSGQVLAYHPVPASDVDSTWPECLQWHHDMGHRLRLHFPLNIGGQLVGIAGLLLSAEEMLDEFQLQQAVVLAQQAAIAMQMERLTRLVESSAVRTERERMAAEIHDNLAQSFTSIAMQSESLAGLLAGDPDKARVLRLIERTAREGLAEARMSVLALLPADGWAGSLDQSLEALVERSSIRGGIECRFESSGRPWAMSGAAQESLLRIAQEATSNAMRHSGGSRVLISLDYGPHRLRLTVEDDGRGLSQPEGPRQNGGFGVSGMANRAAAIGGTVHLGPSPLGGLAVRAEVPCYGAGGAGP